jgi:hypothetical protein
MVNENSTIIGQTPGLPSCPRGLNSVLKVNKRQMYKRRYPMPGKSLIKSEFSGYRSGFEKL